MKGFLSVLFILGLSNPGGIIVITPVPGNVCLSDDAVQTVHVIDEVCQ